MWRPVAGERRELCPRAARAGMSPSDYLQGILERAARRASPAEMRRRLESREPVDPDGLELVTGNLRHFERVPELDLCRRLAEARD